MMKLWTIIFFLFVLLTSVAEGKPFVSIEVDTQRAGGDYTNYVTGTPRQCADDCARDPQCLAFDFSRYDRRCWLKSQVPGSRFNRDVVSGVKRVPSRPAPVTGVSAYGVMSVERDTQRAGGDYTNYVTASSQQCAESCVADTRCLAFDFSIHDSRCWLKNMVPAPRHNRDVVSGVKNVSGGRSTGRWVAGMRIERDTQRPFGDYTNFAVSNSRECARMCSRDSQCRAFDYSKPGRRCWLKNKVPQPRFNRDVISGVKEWKPQRSRRPRAKADPRVETAQGILRLLGYNPGPSDGIMGANTRHALKQVQKQHQLPVTGELDKATYDLLLRLAAK